MVCLIVCDVSGLSVVPARVLVNNIGCVCVAVAGLLTVKVQTLARAISPSSDIISFFCCFDVNMIVALVVVISALTISGVAPASECQMGCSTLTVPTGQCIQAYAHANSQIFRIYQNQISFIGNLTDCDRDTMSRLLDTFCSRDCLSSFVTHRICTGLEAGELEATRTLTLLCTRHADGTFCPVKVLEAANGDPLLPTCARWM